MQHRKASNYIKLAITGTVLVISLFLLSQNKTPGNDISSFESNKDISEFNDDTHKVLVINGEKVILQKAKIEDAPTIPRYIDDSSFPVPEGMHIPIKPGEDYQIVDGNVYFRGYRYLINADSATFEELGSGWAKDAKRVFYNQKTLLDLDPVTTKILVEPKTEVSAAFYSYALDSNSVWLDEIKLDADPATFTAIGDSYAMDSSRVFVYGEEIKGADTKTFTLLSPAQSDSTLGGISKYSKDKNNIYYYKNIVPNADPILTKNLGDGYAVDAEEVFYNGSVVRNIDAKTFTLLGHGFGHDDKKIVYGDKILSLEINPETISMPAENVVVNMNKVFFIDYTSIGPNFTVIPIADAKSFELVGECASVEKSSGSYFKDNNRVYVEMTPIESIDVNSFEYFGGYHSNGEGMGYSTSYSTDKNFVYVGCGNILEGAIRDSFEVLTDGYAKDNLHVWYLGEVIPGANPNSFEILANGLSRDVNSVYFYNKIAENFTPDDCPPQKTKACLAKLYSEQW